MDEDRRQAAKDCYGAAMLTFGASAGVFGWCDLDWLAILLVALGWAFIYAGLYIERRKR